MGQTEFGLFGVLLFVGLAYCAADFILALVLGRCVLPGLKCNACEMAERRERGDA